MCAFLSEMAEIKKQGNHLVARDASGRVLGKITDAKMSRESWRRLLRKVTNNMEDQWSKLLSISRGEPFTVKLPDGRQSEPVVPSIDAQMHASVELLHMVYGRPVPQTDVVQAEEASQEVERVQALTDAELDNEIRKYIAEQKAKGKYNEIIDSSRSSVIADRAPQLPDDERDE